MRAARTDAYALAGLDVEAYIVEDLRAVLDKR
jgi:hypothetical protein